MPCLMIGAQLSKAAAAPKVQLRIRLDWGIGMSEQIRDNHTLGARGIRTLVAGYPTNRISRKRTGPDWPRLGPSPEYNETVRPTATDWIRPPVGISVGIGHLAIAACESSAYRAPSRIF
jgi:hypothetical protein